MLINAWGITRAAMEVCNTRYNHLAAITTEFLIAWLERCSVTAGRQSLNSLPGLCDSHSSQGFYVILSAWIWWLSFDRNPVLLPNFECPSAVYISGPGGLVGLYLHAPLRFLQLPPLVENSPITCTCTGLPIFAKFLSERGWVPIFIGYLLS